MCCFVAGLAFTDASATVSIVPFSGRGTTGDVVATMAGENYLGTIDLFFDGPVPAIIVDRFRVGTSYSFIVEGNGTARFDGAFHCCGISRLVWSLFPTLGGPSGQTLFDLSQTIGTEEGMAFSFAPSLSTGGSYQVDNFDLGRVDYRRDPVFRAEWFLTPSAIGELADPFEVSSSLGVFASGAIETVKLAVPEPSAAALIALGLGAIGLGVRRRKLDSGSSGQS